MDNSVGIAGWRECKRVNGNGKKYNKDYIFKKIK